jgi:hypothetical protein
MHVYILHRPYVKVKEEIKGLLSMEDELPRPIYPSHLEEARPGMHAVGRRTYLVEHAVADDDVLAEHLHAVVRESTASLTLTKVRWPMVWPTSYRPTRFSIFRAPAPAIHPPTLCPAI